MNFKDIKVITVTYDSHVWQKKTCKIYIKECQFGKCFVTQDLDPKYHKWIILQSNCYNPFGIHAGTYNPDSQIATYDNGMEHIEPSISDLWQHKEPLKIHTSLVGTDGSIEIDLE